MDSEKERAILGINAYHGDVSAALICGGQLVAAVEEERFRRIKHFAGFPRDSIQACLTMAGLKPNQIAAFAISRDPRAHFLRKIAFTLRRRPRVDLVRDRVKNAGRVRDLPGVIAKALDLDEAKVRQRTHWVEHHPAHLASAFFVSPFENAALASIDGFGDFVSTSFAIGQGGSLSVLDRVYFPHSLGLLYLAVTQFLGFTKFGDEYKVMGLAPYGDPDYADALRRLVFLRPDGRFDLNLTYFSHWSGGATMTWDDGEPVLDLAYSPKLEELLGPARKDGEPLESRHEAIAASLQVVFEEAVFHVLNALYQRTQLRQLCLAGGCALNSVANGKICERTPFRQVFVQPAAGDNGTALGAAFYVWHQIHHKPRSFVMQHAFWGPESCQNEIDQALANRSLDLDRKGCTARRIEDEDELVRWTAQQISEGKIIGWFQGRMEWGPRALGNRCILADPRRSNMREILNTKIKFREKFRPFAPSILAEAVDEFFVGAVPDPFMIRVYPVRADKRDVIPAVTHVDGSGRLHAVVRESNPRFWKILKAFENLTGVPVLLNTSFNENEPIVHRPGEALECFLRTQLDVLVLGSVVVEKSGTTQGQT